MNASVNRPRIACLAAVAASVLLVNAPAASAQEGTKLPVAHNQTISANPFGLMVEWFNAEYERKVSESTTFGVSASTTGWGDVDLTNGNLFVRYYPQGAALTGFFLGGRAGVAHAGVDGSEATGGAAGFELGYSWLFGSRRNVGVSVGAGIDRLFFANSLDIDLLRPNIRLVNVGIAF